MEATGERICNNKDLRIALLMICYKCKQDLPEDNFSTAKRNVHRNGKQSYCRKCMYEYGKQHHLDNKEHYQQRARTWNISPQRRLKLLLNASTSDRSLLTFDWAWDKLQAQDFKCELTGISFTWEARQPTALSIDRIDPTKGYTKENVRFVCWWINAAMGNWGFEKLKDLLKESNFAS